jgi:aerobic carbon-monoxide dehydrogenase large subunit
MAIDGIGASVLRKEDRRFLTGAGTYTDDVSRPNQTYMHVIRSPHAHAKIGKIAKDAALKSPGVLAVFTGADLAAEKIGNLPAGWLIHSKDGTPMVEPPHPALAHERARHVGDPVAIVIAETRDQAHEAAELVEVEYGELPAVASIAQATKPGAPLVWDQGKGNLCYDFQMGDEAAANAAFAKAHKVVKLDLVNNRLIPNAIEPRAAVGEYDRATQDFTLYTTSQNPHLIRLLLGAFSFGVPEHKLRVVAPDVGGGFGSKIFHYPEELLVLWAARKVGRPVKWTAARSESFMSDAHGRDHVTHAELAVAKDGTFLGLKVQTHANLGAYLSTFAPAVPTYLYVTLLAGCYKTPVILAQVKAVFTNTVPVDAYRGAGRPEAAFLLERLVDLAARELGMDRVEIRRKNFIDKFPYQTPVALEYDSGDYKATLDAALDKARWSSFEERRAEARRRGKLRGIGLSTYVEACGIAPSAVAGALGARAGLYECASIRVHPTGSISVFTGTHSHGQGHETTFAQLVAEKLGVPVANVEVVHGDTSKIPFGMGTYGSRSLAVGGSALVQAADKVIAKARKIAAHLLEAGEGDLEFKDGKFTVMGTDRSKTFGEIALTAYIPHKYPAGLEPGLEETAFYDPKNFTFPAGAHVAEVEVDPETGRTDLVAFTAVDDVGRVVNPMIVEGQVHGGVAIGVGQALLEGALYDDAGQLVSGSFLSYAMPRAGDVPFMTAATNATNCTHNPLGAKGVGETGSIGSPPAVINALVDALKDLGVRHVDMPATSERVWRAIRDAKKS